MTRRAQGWPAGLTHAVGIAVRRLRRERGLTGDDVVEALDDIGVTMTRAGLTNLEAGRREGIGLHEVYALAAVLGVAPLRLMVDDMGAEMEILPGRITDAPRAAQWIAGQLYAGAADVPLGPEYGTEDTYTESSRPFDDLLMHAALVRDVEHAQRTLDGPAGTSIYQRAVGALLDMRAQMERNGITDPPLPPSLAYLEASEKATTTAKETHDDDQ